MSSTEQRCGLRTAPLMAKTPATRTLLEPRKLHLTACQLAESKLQVYARTGSTSRDISLFLVEKGTKGFSLGQKIQAGQRLALRF